MQTENVLKKLGYEPLPRFRIFDEHVFQKKGKPPQVFDRARLQRIADKMNARDSEFQSLVPCIVAHTEDEGDEKPVVGYAINHKVEKFGKKWFITSEPFAAPGHRTTFQKHPRRSVEIWIDPKGEDDDIDPVSLLGGTAPRRDELGVHLFSRIGETREHYSRNPDEEEQMDDQTPDTAGAAAPGNMEQIVAAVLQSKPMQEIIGIVSEIKDLLAQEGTEHEPGAEATTPPPEEPDAGAGPAAGASGTPPQEPPMEREQMSRGHDTNMILERMQRENAELHNRLAAVERERNEAEIDRQLATLAGEFEFDAAEERGLLVKMSRKDQAAHILRIRTRYQKKSRPLPNGGQALHGDTNRFVVKNSRVASIDEQTAEAYAAADPFEIAKAAAASGKSLDEAAMTVAKARAAGNAVTPTR